MNTKTYILTLAGHDPSAGAGLTSDIKTFEAHGLYGLSVCTAITVQNDVDFKHCVWMDTAVILSQIDALFDRFEIHIVKIGLIPSWKTLGRILEKLHRLNSNIKIVLDPIFKASAGFDFHTTKNQSPFDFILKHCYIITPNYDEIQYLYPEKNIQDTLNHISKTTNIYLKGGHRPHKKGWDALYHSGIVMINIPPNVSKVSEKHGSGCVLASALASQLALGIPLEDACKHAKYYTEHFLNSNTSLLGTHYKL
ncbi:hydroxymethylpyrimidine/phosphomethylpyrimidine kinase [Mariniflexile ostreae]|uniref:hydroxymethylpyrimidine kinase n=1 Tax=Mariniflexile ostreae TaxID=1520892 RepID=A0ABV5FBL3_9FLAO